MRRLMETTSEPTSRREEVVGDGVAVVQRLLGAEAHDHRLGADRQRAGEDVVVVDGGLQVHEPLAREVVGAVQLGLVADARDADPLPAVVGLHEERVADALGDLAEVEGAVVAGRRVGPARVVGRALERHEDRARHLQPAADHRAVGRVLLHRLEGEGAVEQVDVVHHRHLLQPLARVVVPVGEAIDDQLVARLVAQVEGLDGQALDVDAVARAVLALDRPQARDDGLEGGGPVVLGAEEQADVMDGVGHQQKRGRWWASCARQDGQSWATSYPQRSSS